MFSIYLSKEILYYFCFVAALFGAAMGSFLNCAAWRIARGESFLTGRSRCPACGHTLGPVDLLPVLGWLVRRGRCHYCGAPVAPRYFLTECAFAALTVLCLLRFDLSALCLRNYIFLCCLFCLSLVDLDSFIIPDGCLLLPALAWFAALPWCGLSARQAAVHVLSALLCGGAVLALSLLMDKLLQKESLGGGDIKLFALVALYLGPVAFLFALLFSCVLGLLFAAATRRGTGTPFPFGPAIAAACTCMLLFGQGLTAWYLSLLGL